MSHNITPGPVAPYNNPPINPQYYQPRDYTIAAIILGINTIVTTDVNHDYVIGQQVRLLIPSQYGSTQLNEVDGYVISIPAANQVVTTINSTNANPFIANPSYGPTPPQIVAIGDINSGITGVTSRNVSSTNIPGAFINISPL